MAARRRVRVPSVADMMKNSSGGTAYEREILQSNVEDTTGVSGRGSGSAGVGQAARASTGRKMNYDTALAIQAAKEGDDSELLSYQPTPSINPPRPRTLAAGYDRDTGVMRVRFRDGAIYGYSDVSPNEWRNFRRVMSPGRAINRTFNSKPFWREPWT